MPDSHNTYQNVYLVLGAAASAGCSSPESVVLVALAVRYIGFSGFVNPESFTVPQSGHAFREM